MTRDEVIEQLHRYANKKRADNYARFFKSEYKENEIFLGVPVPVVRRLVHEGTMILDDVSLLLQSSVHEEKIAGALLLVHLYRRASDNTTRRRVYAHYLRCAKQLNNWDLVDISAPYIVGDWAVRAREYTDIFKLVRSKNHWERRVGMVAQLPVIKAGILTTIQKTAPLMFDDEEDLMHKATGWMLREAGKQNQKALEKFLQQHIHRIPRVMLRYAIEKFPTAKRHRYLVM